MTNLLQAGQLSQNSLSRRVGKADTLESTGKPVPWQQRATNPAGFFFPGHRATPMRQIWAQAPSLSLIGRVTVQSYCVSPSLSFPISLVEPPVLPPSQGLPQHRC